MSCIAECAPAARVRRVYGATQITEGQDVPLALGDGCGDALIEVEALALGEGVTLPHIDGDGGAVPDTLAVTEGVAFALGVTLGRTDVTLDPLPGTTYVSWFRPPGALSCTEAPVPPDPPDPPPSVTSTTLALLPPCSTMPTRCPPAPPPPCPPRPPVPPQPPRPPLLPSFCRPLPL